MKAFPRTSALLSLLALAAAQSVFAQTDTLVKSTEAKQGEASSVKIVAGKQTENFFAIPSPAEGRPEKLPFLLYAPRDYDAAKKYPLLLFLHGVGESGDGDFKKLAIHGPPKRIGKEGQHYPFIVVSPQSPMPGMEMEEIIVSWKTNELMALLDQVEAQLSIDKTRVYVSGMSMGGFGTWRLVADHPERFAAAIPVCGGGKIEWAEKLKSVPIWAFHGAKDGVVPFKLGKEIVDAIQLAGGDVKLTVYPKANHDSWTATYENAEIYKWLLRHKRKD